MFLWKILTFNHAVWHVGCLSRTRAWLILIVHKKVNFILWQDTSYQHNQKCPAANVLMTINTYYIKLVYIVKVTFVSMSNFIEKNIFFVSTENRTIHGLCTPKKIPLTKFSEIMCQKRGSPLAVPIPKTANFWNRFLVFYNYIYKLTNMFILYNNQLKYL